MARKTYRLSDETFQALINHEADIAREHNCDPSYIYGIKNQKHPDPYPPFRELYAATRYGGGDTSFWRDDLKAIEKAADPSKTVQSLYNLLLSEIDTYAGSIRQILKAVADGTIDERETRQLIRSIEGVQKNIEIALDELHRHLGELTDEGKKIRSIG